MPRKSSLDSTMEVDFMTELPVWSPRKFQIQRIREHIVDSDRATICAVPDGANVFSGKGIPSDALVLSSHHLRFLRFPLHPVFQILWRILGLHPMQLNPNSYLLLAAWLAMGRKWEVPFGIGDFFFCHRLVHIAESDSFFNFCSRPLRGVFGERGNNFSGWKNEPIMVRGEWAAPEIPTNIPKAFSTGVLLSLFCLHLTTIPILIFEDFYFSICSYASTSVDSLLEESRTEWIKENVLRRKWCVAQFASKEVLEDLSKLRTGAIYSTCFQSLDINLSGDALLKHVITLERQFLLSDRTPALFASSLEVEVGLEKQEVGGMDVRRIKAPAPQGRKFKKAKLTVAVAESPRGENAFNGNGPSNVDKENTTVFPLPSSNLSDFSNALSNDCSSNLICGADFEACPLALPSNLKPPMQLAFQKGDGSYVLEGDPIAFDRDSCLAVAQTLAMNDSDQAKINGMSVKDMAAFIALALQTSSSMVQQLVIRTDASEISMWGRVKDAERKAEKNAIMVEELRKALENKCQVLETRDKEICELKNKLENEITNRAMEFDLNQSEILKSSCKYYRLGWVQGQQSEGDRIFDDPDAFDRDMKLDHSEYNWILGMHPSDKPEDEVDSAVA